MTSLIDSILIYDIWCYMLSGTAQYSFATDILFQLLLFVNFVVPYTNQFGSIEEAALILGICFINTTFIRCEDVILD